jgi:hypothetical protein
MENLLCRLFQTLLRTEMSYDSTCWFVIDIEVTGSILYFTVATSIA